MLKKKRKKTLCFISKNIKLQIIRNYTKIFIISFVNSGNIYNMISSFSIFAKYFSSDLY